MIGREHVITTLLEQTIDALSVLDHVRLLPLEQQITVLAKAGMIQRTSSLVDRQNLLKRMLNETKENLAILKRLQSGNGNHLWAL
jgi:hypothetical protein